MLKIYISHLETNQFEEIQEPEVGSWINMINPTEEEINYICEKINIKPDFIKYSLDYEEKARIDMEDNDGTILFVIDTPIIEKNDKSEIYTTMPVGIIFVRDEYFITVSLNNNMIIDSFENMRIKNFSTYKKSRFLLQIMYTNSGQFLKYLNHINKETEVTENNLKDSMKNKELIKLLSLEKSLVYFSTSLKSNELVMEKTMNGKIIKLYDEDEDILEDAIIENRQAIEMCKIYTDILSNTMDAYASIISNNVNGVMKILTSITIILTIPTLIASLWGMNVPVPMQSNPLGFTIIVVASIIIAFITMWWFRKRNMLD